MILLDRKGCCQQLADHWYQYRRYGLIYGLLTNTGTLSAAKKMEFALHWGIFTNIGGEVELRPDQFWIRHWKLSLHLRSRILT